MSNEQEVEQFDGFTPEGIPSANDGAVDTFDSYDAIEVPQEEEVVEEVKQEKESPEGEKEENGQTATMDSAEQIEAKKAAEAEKSDDEEEEKKDGDKEPEGESEDKEGDSEEKPTGKVVRFKKGDDSVDVDEESTVAVKVDGKKQFVPIKELMKNYSGEQSWDKKFNDFETQKNTFSEERDTFNAQKDEIMENLAPIGKHLQEIFTNPEADPAEALRYLVDIGGHDVLKFEQRMLEHYGTLAMEYDDMDESQQKLYWSEKKNQILQDNQANQAKRSETRKAEEERVNQEIEVRKQYGVSDKDFEEAQTQMAKLGYETKELSAKQVCEYITVLPFAEKAEDVCSQFSEDLGDDEMVNLITATTNVLRDNDYLEPEEAVKLAGRKLGFQIEDINDDISKLNEKVSTPENRLKSEDKSKKKVGKKRDDGHIESFDDYDADLYNYG